MGDVRTMVRVSRISSAEKEKGVEVGFFQKRWSGLLLGEPVVVLKAGREKKERK
jgi:hypothetical protein